MKKFLICAAFVFLFGNFASGQNKSLTGDIVKEILENKWAAIVIDVGGKKYAVQTEFHASFGDEKDGVKSWKVKTIGNISEGRTVQVFYKKIDCTHAYEEGVPCWLDATRIVEVKRAVRPITPRGASVSQDWGTFWNVFRAAVRKRDRVMLRTMMPSRFLWGIDDYIAQDQVFQNLDESNGKLWRQLKIAVTRGARRCHPPYCNLTQRPAYHTWLPLEALFELGTDGQWRWTGVLGD
jgi:hypothetical protein